MRFDATGKVTLDHIYNRPDPRAYFRELRELDYCVPQQAKPYFAKLMEEYRDARQVAVPKVLDIGCSYGINAALLKYDVTMDALYARYCDEHLGGESGAGGRARAEETSEALLARDRKLARSHRPARPVRFVGLDTSGSALAYALEAGFLDDAVHANLEHDEPSPRQRAQFAGTDLVISTGCIGYVTERTLTRIVRSTGGQLPWMAHFVLRMFPFDPVERALEELGYSTVRVDDVFRQRRFASPQEQTQVLETMKEAGVDADGLEADGWLYARLYLSRPSGTAGWPWSPERLARESAATPGTPASPATPPTDEPE
ncbi:class I SAM-dependent methyltransferase [Streptomyces bathyalis]|uniref:Class I SAM-dependent methyltransferase n=1 Tax=Streptomyces bathyalis TaxID=2710756 RepID=A0A7T1TA97_9ACTN|nr:class I SAM-dependent methyltransferase [Streptomyces bathyalis]QPP09230.1 class I SAM-dependent methyltransferase [Streptomyces bathyalis]